MSYNKYMYVFIVFWISSFMVLQSEAVCDSLLLSLSNAGICEDGVCIAKELAQTRLSLDESSSFCFRVDQHEFNSPDKVVNFTILDSWVSYPIDNCYFSDDPQVSVQGYCSCPLSGAVDCQNCPLLGISNATNVCLQGVNNGKGCFGTAGGSHCAIASFMGGNRYKICKIGSPTIEILYKFYDSINMQTAAIKLTELTTISTSQANLTFYDVNVDHFKVNDHVVIDLLNPNYVYVVPNDKINDISSVNTDKLGWFRYNTTLNPKVSDEINVAVSQCSNDDFRFGIGLPQFREILGNHPEWQLNSKFPGSLISDPDAATVLGIAPVYDPPLPILVQGGYFLDNDGVIIGFGLTVDGSPVSSGSSGQSPTILTNKGKITGQLFACGAYFYMGYFDLSGVRNNYYVRQCNLVGNPSTWGICRQLLTTDLTSGISTSYVNCTVPNFYGIRWPDNYAAEWLPYWDGGESISFSPTADHTIPQYNVTSDRLLRLTSESSSKVDVEFLNITVKFDVTNVHPEIKRIDNDDSYIFVYAESTTVKGNCLLMTSDDVTPTKTIELSLVENKYKLPIIIRKFKGDIEVVLQCYKNKDVAKFYIEVNKDQVDINYNELKPSSVKVLSKEDSVFNKVSNGISKTGKGILFGLSFLFDLTSNSVANFFIGILLSALSLAAALIAIYLAIKYVLPKIWCWFKKFLMWLKYKVTMKKPPTMIDHELTSRKKRK